MTSRHSCSYTPQNHLFRTPYGHQQQQADPLPPVTCPRPDSQGPLESLLPSPFLSLLLPQLPSALISICLLQVQSWAEVVFWEFCHPVISLPQQTNVYPVQPMSRSPYRAQAGVGTTVLLPSLPAAATAGLGPGLDPLPSLCRVPASATACACPALSCPRFTDTSRLLGQALVGSRHDSDPALSPEGLPVL